MVGKNAKTIREHIQNQLEEALAGNQISLKEYMDPFMGSKKVRQKKTAAVSGCL